MVLMWVVSMEVVVVAYWVEKLVYDKAVLKVGSRDPLRAA
jgi:hypothetical protein